MRDAVEKSQASLSEELRKAQQEILDVNQKVILNSSIRSSKLFCHHVDSASNLKLLIL